MDFMIRKYALLIMIAIFFVLNIKLVNAQKFYAGIATGYGFSMASQNLASKIENGITQTSNATVKGSFGRGLLLGGYIGYKKNENIGTELGISYLIGNKYSGYYSKELDFNEKTVMSANMFRLSPGIRISVGDGKIKPYAKLGLAFRIFGKITIKDSHYDIQNNETTETEWKYSNGASIGIIASLGITKKISEKISIFGELGMINQSWGPKKGKITKYAINGVDMLSNLTPSQNQTNYIDSYTTTNNSSSATWSPRQQLRQYYPFSSIGLNIGLHLKFGKS